LGLHTKDADSAAEQKRMAVDRYLSVINENGKEEEMSAGIKRTNSGCTKQSS